MPKMKTSKTAAKRFKKTGTGRLRRAQQMNQHKFYEKSVAAEAAREVRRRRELGRPAQDQASPG